MFHRCERDLRCNSISSLVMAFLVVANGPGLVLRERASLCLWVEASLLWFSHGFSSANHSEQSAPAERTRMCRVTLGAVQRAEFAKGAFLLVFWYVQFWHMRHLIASTSSFPWKAIPSSKDPRTRYVWTPIQSGPEVYSLSWTSRLVRVIDIWPLVTDLTTGLVLVGRGQNPRHRPTEGKPSMCLRRIPG